jgi:hypothetical protein
MNEQQLILIQTVMEMIGGTIDNYDADPHHAPARWLLNNWWHTLNGVLRLEVGNQFDSNPNSFEATDEAESKKRDEDIQPDESFEV